MSRLRFMRHSWFIVPLAVIALTFVASRSSALHRDTPVFVQVTTQTSGDIGHIGAYTPEFWGFAASGDVLSNGSTGSQVYFFDLTKRVFQGQQGITQVTFGP